jgi:hypothetical protein
LLFRSIGEAVQFDAKTPADAAKEVYEAAVVIRSNK